MNQPLGILDSGVGGLTIWQEVVKQLPHESAIYLADSKNCPYGTKTSEEIYTLSKRLVGFLVKARCKLIVVACNTITVACLDRLRVDFSNLPIVGTVPVVKTAAAATKNGRIGILSTLITAKSQYQKDLIREFASACEVTVVGTDRLVPLVEQGSVEGRTLELIVTMELLPFMKAKIDTLVLGCSHFPLVRKQIQKILGSHVQILDSGGAIARQTGTILRKNDILARKKEPRYVFYTTGGLRQFEKTLKKFRQADRLEKVNL